MILVGAFLVLIILGYVAYDYIWPEFLYREMIRNTPSFASDTIGFVEALRENKDCIKEAWGRGRWVKYLRSRSAPSDELLQKAFPCLEAGRIFIANLTDNKDCFLRWWGEEKYHEITAHPRILSNEAKQEVWWCFPELVSETYRDENRARAIKKIQDLLLANRLCFIAAWGEDIYRDYLKYPREFAKDDKESTIACLPSQN